MRLVLPVVVLVLNACTNIRPDTSADVSPAEHYLRYGVAAFADGQAGTAAIRFRQALELAIEQGDREVQVRAHLNLGELLSDVKELEKSAYHMEQAMHLVAQLQDIELQRRTQLLAASVAIQRQDFARAREYLHILCEVPADNKQTDTITLAALTNRAIVAEATQSADLSNWVQRLSQALRSTGNTDPALQGRLSRFEARLAISAGDLDSADEHYREALGFYEQARQQRAVGITLSLWAQLDIDRQQWQAAREKLKRSILILDAGGNHEGVVEALNRLAGVEMQLGHEAESAALRRFAAALRENPGRAPRSVEGLGLPSN